MLTQRAISKQEHRLLREIKEVRADLRSMNNRRVRDLGDIVDQANDAMEFATRAALRGLRQRQLVQLERAWDRLCIGLYGICEFCGQEIALARLEAVPYATLCMHCQRQAEQSQHHH
jgi:DnaK suppressor protein